MFGTSISLLGVPAGWAIDLVGIRPALLAGAALAALSRAALATTTSSTVAGVLVCVLLPLGESVGIPALSAAGVHPRTEADSVAISKQRADADRGLQSASCQWHSRRERAEAAPPSGTTAGSTRR